MCYEVFASKKEKKRMAYGVLKRSSGPQRFNIELRGLECRPAR